MSASSHRTKRALWWLALPLGIILVVGGLQFTSGVYSYLERERVLSSALNITSEPRDVEKRLSWLADDPLPRRVEPLTRERIRRDYLFAFDELSYSLLTGNGGGLGSYFQSGALTDASLAVSSELRSKFIDWDHRLKLHFYAPDGGTVAFTDTYKYAQGTLLGTDIDDVRLGTRELSVIMTLDDGAWRIHHWRVNEDAEQTFERPLFPNLAADIEALRGINYISRSAPFDAFWNGYNPAEVDADFARISQLGLNTVRFFIPYPAPAGLADNLPKLLATAERHQLKLIPTLLDGYTAYALEDLPDVLLYLQTLEEALEHKQVFLIDLKNEADSDFASAGETRTTTFLGYLTNYLRDATEKPLTVGLISPSDALMSAVDVVSVHHYGDPEALVPRLAEAADYGKPVLLEEFGFHSWAFKLPDPHSQSEQARYYFDVVNSAEAVGAGWLAWTLYDLPTGEMPGERRVERHLGIFEADGQPKPVIAVLQGATPPSPGFFDRVLKLRYLLGVGLLVVGLIAAWVARQRWRGKKEEEKRKMED